MTNARMFPITATARIIAKPLAWLCGLMLFSCQALSAPSLFSTSPALTIDGLTPSYAVAPHIDFLEDASGALAIAEVAKSDDKFRPVPASGNNEINFGYSSSAYWLRLVINTPVPIPDDLLLEVGFPSLDHVEFYAEAETGGHWEKLEAGDLMPFAARPVAHRNFIFPLHRLQPGQHAFYLRIASGGTLTIPLRLWQADAFDRHNQNSYAALALYFGMLLALMLYNLMLYFSLRDRNYLAYVCVVIGMAVGQVSLTGLGNQFLWPGWPAWGNVALPAGFAATAFFAALFTRGFLHTAQMAPRHDRVVVALAWLSAFIALSPAILPYTWSAILTSLIGIIFPAAAVSTGIVCLRRDQPGARFFLLAWTLLLCGTAILGLRNMGWVPTNFFTLYAMLIGSALEILLLSFALADRIHALRREKEQAQNEALAISQRAERELEGHVAERTRELSETNALLLASEEQEHNRNKVLEVIAKGAPITDILNILAQAVEQSAEGKLCSILLLDEEGKHLLLGAAPSLPDFYNQAIHGVAIGEGIGSCGTAAFRGERVIVEDVQTHPFWVPFHELAGQAGLTSCWSEPICSGKGEVLGTFAIYQRQPGGPSTADIALVQQSCHLASIAIERKRLDELMWSQANYDFLTKLPNRRLFRDRLQQDIKKTQRAGLSLALMFIDLDMFKEVNDTLGHDVGDLLLVDVARRRHRGAHQRRRIHRDSARTGRNEPRGKGRAEHHPCADPAILHRRGNDLYLGQRRHHALSERCHRTGEPAEKRRPCDVRRQRSGTQLLQLFHQPDAGRSAEPHAHDQGSARRPARQPVQGIFPAHCGHGERTHRQSRGAAALVPSRARHGRPGAIHPARRRSRPDRRYRQLGIQGSGALDGALARTGL